VSTKRQKAGLLFFAALAGIASGAVFLAVAELVALLVAKDASPILAVGSFVIDIVPQPLKEFAISTFGSNDKIALLTGLGLAVVVASAIAGILQLLRPPLGVIALGIAGILSIAAIVTRASVTPLSFLPPVLGTVAGALVLIWLRRHLPRRRTAPRGADAAAAPDAPVGHAPEAAEPVPASTPIPENPAALTDPEDPAARRDTGTATAAHDPMDRRRFLLLTALAGASAIVVGVSARVVSAATSSAEAVRKALHIPGPRTKVAVPAGAELDVPGISSLFTPNKSFYRVDTALTVPSIDPGTWRLVIDGMVEKRVELSFDDLVKMGLDEYAITLTCVSNEVGGNLVGNAKWTGVPVRDILRMARPKKGADMVLSRSVDGFTASTPLSSLVDDDLDAILAVTMNGVPLPLEHGFPVRMVVPGLYGYVSATKWLTELKVTTFAKDQAYWTPRGYSAQAPIKLSSRVDTPKIGKPVAAGRVPVAGVAWAQSVGIERVEVRIDDGAWMPATLASPINEDTWVQWMLEWDATPGVHYVEVRAFDKKGRMQAEKRTPIAPNGSTGWQRSLISVS